MPTSLRRIGMIVLDPFIAFVYVVIVGLLLPRTPLKSWMIEREWIAVTAGAFLAGFAMYQQLRSNRSRYAWVIPALWFCIGLLNYLHGDQIFGPVAGSRYGIMSHFSGQACMQGDDLNSCRAFYAFTVWLLSGVAYSIGALFAAIAFPATTTIQSEDQKGNGVA
jgi:hypothetical protein